MQEFAEKFYKSQAWKNCREAYAKSQGGLCERCRAMGKIVPGEIVHHKIAITKNNIDDPKITLATSNCQLLCRDCHAAVHKKNITRYFIDENGRVIMQDTAPYAP